MAETTGKVLLAYDVTDNWEAVKSTLIHEYGYTDVGLSEHKVYTLPNTTLFHHRKQVSQAIKDIQLVCHQRGAILEKAVAVLTTEAAYYNN